jgi:4-hydroxy-tetrahydrodipicolinate reductase
MEKTRVGVAGALGRMGRGIVKKVHEAEDLELVIAIEAPGSPNKDRDIGELVGLGRVGVDVVTADELGDALKKVNPEVLIDFTTPEAAVENIKTAAEKGVNLVVGTTGFSEEQRREIEAAVIHNNAAAVISPNMATGVNVFFKTAVEVAGYLKEYDVEIIEAHHRFKRDAPSGTALRAGELIAETLGRDLEENAVYGRGRGVIGERKDGEIGFHSIRGGDVVGDHTVIFAGDGERLEITHRASSREAFVNGALKAVRFLKGRERGKIYTTWDVLGIRK